MKIISRILLPAALLVYIGAETWMKWQHTSLCSSSGCTLAGELLRFDSLYLNYLGFFSVASILIMGIFSLRSSVAEIFYFTVLYAAVSFESILIGYQIFANPEPCIFCIGVYSSLLSIAIISNWRYFLFASPALVSIFIALGTLSIPKNTAVANKEGIYLIYSKKCPHCKKVKRYFSQKEINYTPLPVTSPGNRYLAKILGIGEIPILVNKKRDRIEILHGDRAIVEYFENRDPEHSESSGQSNVSGIKSSDLYDDSSREGCTLSPEKNSECEESGPEIPLR